MWKIIHEAHRQERLIAPSIIRENLDLFARVRKEVAELFANSLESMLLWPVKNKTALAIDPNYMLRLQNCKELIHKETLDKDIIYPTPPKNQKVQAAKIVNDLINKYNVNVIAIGNGTTFKRNSRNLLLI